MMTKVVRVELSKEYLSQMGKVKYFPDRFITVEEKIQGTYAVILPALQMMLRIWCLTWRRYFYDILMYLGIENGGSLKWVFMVEAEKSRKLLVGASREEASCSCHRNGRRIVMVLDWESHWI